MIAGVDLSGQRAIVTGGTSGIGVETARALAGAGAEVTLAVRDTAAGERVAATSAATCRVAALDLTDLASVDDFVAAWHGPLDILVNNAGVMAMQDLTSSPSGHEMQFATNHLGHFALAIGLHDALVAAGGARIVSVSSSGHLRSPVMFDDLDFAFRDYDPFAAYGQSKTANVLFAVEATRRWADDGIVANALMPGGIADPAAAAPRAGVRRAGADERFRRAGSRLQDRRAGRGHVDAARRITAAGRCRRTLLRGLQRGHGGGPSRRASASLASRHTRSIRRMPNGCGIFR